MHDTIGMKTYHAPPIPMRTYDMGIYEKGLNIYSELRPKMDKLFGEKAIDVLSLELNQEINYWSLVIDDLSKFAKGSMLKDLTDTMNDTVYELMSLKESVKKPFLLFVVGMGKYGKSTLVNALLGKDMADVGVLPKTWKIDIFEKAELTTDNVTVEMVFRDSAREVMTEADARRFLSAEEQKRKGSETEAMKVFNANHANLPTLEAKEQYKAYLEKTMIYQSQVEEVIWRIPGMNAILDEFRLVDTPGLIQDLLGDERYGLSDYYFKADGVIWLLDATTISSKNTQDLIKKIIKLSGNDRSIDNSIAVLNRIDQVYEQQGKEGVEKVMAQALEIYGDVFPKIIPFSAKQAWLGVSSINQQLIQQSNIEQLLFHIREVFSAQARVIRYRSKSKGIGLLNEKMADNVNDYLARLQADTYKLRQDSKTIPDEAQRLAKSLKRHLIASLERYRNQVNSRIRTTICDLDAVKQLDTEGKFVASKILKTNELIATYNGLLKDIEAGIEDFLNFQVQEVTFREFALIKQIRVQAQNIHIEAPTISLDDSFTDKTSANTVSAGAVGALIGSFVVPGLGTMIGAFLGGLLGSIISESAEDKLKRLHDKIQSKTDEIVNNLIAKINLAVDANMKPAVDSLALEQVSSFSRLHCGPANEHIVSDQLYGVLGRFVSEDIATNQISMMIALMSPEKMAKFTKE